jgi:hypothetical protein
MGVIKLIFGLALTSIAVYLIDYNLGRTWTKMTTGSAIFLGVILGAGVRLLFTGGAQTAGKRFLVLPSLGIFFAIVIAAAVALPRAHDARLATAEQSAWARLQASPKTSQDYENYINITPKPRRGVLPAQALAKTRQELAAGPKVSTLRPLLRSHLYDMQKTGEPEFQEAIDLTRKGLADAYAKALAQLQQRTATGPARREFPEDPQMRAAFAAVLARLAQSEDDYVYLDFASDNQLATPATQPAADSREIPPGDAFSPERDSRRRSAFASAMTDSLTTAFKDDTVMRITSLSPGDDRKGKVIFDVKCTPHRVRGGFTLTVGGKEAGTLFNFDVDWQFSVIDADGKVLAQNHSRSNPAGSIRFSTRRSDPDWAPYSVLMDSAYYNYCREITGRLGLIPPAIKESFTFTQ